MIGAGLIAVFSGAGISDDDTEVRPDPIPGVRVEG